MGALKLLLTLLVVYGRRARAPAILFLALLAAYGVLRQDVQYGDGILFLMQLRDRFLCSHNWLYLPAMDGFARVLRPWASEAVACGWFSAVCAAGGCAWLFAWLRAVVVDAAAAWLGALLVASSPAVLFFATTIENHAHHLFWVGAFLLLFRWSSATQSPAWLLLPGVVLIGVFGSHQTGILLVPGLVLLFLAWRAERMPIPQRADGLRIAALLLPLAAVKLLQLDRWLKAEWLHGGEAFWKDEGLTVFREQVANGAPLSQWPDYWRSDVLEPAFALVLLAALGLLISRRRRMETLAVAVAVVPYLLFFARWHIPERGAYYTAVWPLLALCAARGLADATGPWRRSLQGLAVLAVAAQAWIGVQRIQDFERADPYRPWVERVSAVCKPGAFLLVGDDHRAVHAKYWARLDTQQAQAVHNLARLGELSSPGSLAGFPAVAVADLRGRATRQELYVEAEAWAYLEEQWPQLARQIDAAFQRHALPPERGLAGYRLEAR